MDEPDGELKRTYCTDGGRPDTEDHDGGATISMHCRLPDESLLQGLRIRRRSGPTCISWYGSMIAPVGNILVICLLMAVFSL